jgi:hypothetical protein
MPTDNEELNELLRRARQEWDSAEENLKEAEQAINRQVVPAINELRYAGRRIVDALQVYSTSKDVNLAKEYLNHAIYNCHCAKHDAIDVCLSVMVTNVDAARKRYGYHNILAAFPQLPEMLECLRDVNKKVALSRGDRINREKIYESINNQKIPALKVHYERFLSSEPVYSAVTWKNRLIWAVPVGCALLAATVAIAMGIYNHPKSVSSNRAAIYANQASQSISHQ